MLHIRRTDDVSRSVNALFFCEPRILARLYVSYVAPVTLILLASPALWTCRVGLTWAFDEHAMALIGDPRRQPPRFTVQWIPPGINILRGKLQRIVIFYKFHHAWCGKVLE